MIALTRRLAKELRIVFRKALGISHGAAPPLRVTSGPEGLRIRARKQQFAVEYRVAGPLETHDLIVPAQALDDLQGSKAEPASLYRRREGVIGATWEEHGVSRHLEYAEPPPEEDEFPEAPEILARNSPRLRKALQDAFETADAARSRYALGCIQLRGGQGSVAATDGRQLLLQRGFAWGFDDTLLIPKVGLFGCKLLGDDSDVLVGRTEHQVMFRIGAWSFWFPIETEGRFPKVDDVIPSASGADTVWQLAPGDAKFLAENVHRLPGNPDERRLTVELNGKTAIRARTTDSPQGVELLLKNSPHTGADVLIGLDRRNLLRAATLGFEKIYLRGPSAALLAEDATRAFVWMPLSDEQLTTASENLLRIESPPAGQPRIKPRSSSRSRTKMSSFQPSAAPSPVSDSGTPRRVLPPTTLQNAADSLEQAIQVRDQFRTSLAAVKELIRMLQAERRSHRLLKSTLASLKNLQKVA